MWDVRRRVEGKTLVVGVVEQIPIVHVHQDRHRLTEDQRQPHDDVAGAAALEQLVGEHAERDLTEHPVEGPQAEHVQRNGHLKRCLVGRSGSGRSEPGTRGRMRKPKRPQPQR